MAHPREFAEGLSIGIIMDGNGRWAKNRGLPRTAGHKKGAEVFSDIADYCDELGVSSVYFYAFSTENWKRPLEEVNAIMRLFGEYLLKGLLQEPQHPHQIYGRPHRAGMEEIREVQTETVRQIIAAGHQQQVLQEEAEETVLRKAAEEPEPQRFREQLQSEQKEYSICRQVIL